MPNRPPDDDAPSRLYSVQDVAELLSISKSQVRRLVELGELEMLILGVRGNRITQHSINNYVKAAKRKIPKSTT